MSLLTVTKEFAKRTKLPIPTFVASNTDAQVGQIHGSLNELCEDLDVRKGWEVTTLEAEFVSVAGEDQGRLTTLAPSGFRGIVLDSMFDRTTGLAIRGAVSPQEWQRRKALAASGPLHNFRIRGGKLLFNPALEAGHTITFEYHSNYFVQDELTNPKEYFTADTDSLRLGDGVCLQWLRWHWKKEKGLDYAEEFRAYELYITTIGLREAAPARIDMSERSGPLFGIEVPEGSWNLS